MLKVEPELVLEAYRQGAFPMARSAEGPIEWFTADPRAILPLDERFHVRKSLARALRKRGFEITQNRAFERVIRGCAEPRAKSPGTWINEQMVELYVQLHEAGHGHSVEAWGDEGELAGGIYGVAVGGAFFGESMFSRQAYASQACLVHLVEHLQGRGFELFDVQFTNRHLEQFGVLEVGAERYLRWLGEAVTKPVRF